MFFQTTTSMRKKWIFHSLNFLHITKYVNEKWRRNNFNESRRCPIDVISNTIWNIMFEISIEWAKSHWVRNFTYDKRVLSETLNFRVWASPTKNQRTIICSLISKFFVRKFWTQYLFSIKFLSFSFPFNFD